MKHLFTLLISMLCFSLFAQVTTDMESFELENESFLNGMDGSGGFQAGNIFLPNLFNTQFNSWSGWSISNTTDITTPGFDNPFSAITGSGYENSSNYAISFVFNETQIKIEKEADSSIGLEGMYVTNSTWAYLSIKNGDNFTKKFGGLSGDDPDYFLLTIKKYEDGQLSSDSINFYLADYRFEDNSQDYILDEWTYVDLSSLGNVDSLSFSLSSTDNGMFGMNTPAYFCMDNFTTKDEILTIQDQEAELVTIYPNPSSQFITVTPISHSSSTVSLYDSYGNKIISNKILSPSDRLNINHLDSGMYHLRINMGSKSVIKSFLKI